LIDGQANQRLSIIIIVGLAYLVQISLQDISRYLDLQLMFKDRVSRAISKYLLPQDRDQLIRLAQSAERYQLTINPDQ